MDKKHSGAHNELAATVWLMKQGFEVFRNVSPHGAVDIIAMKEGEITLFDVKRASLRIDGEPVDLKLKPDQVALGVKLIVVFGDDYDCRIIHEPKVVYGRTEKCIECNGEFIVRKPRQKFCAVGCRAAFKNRKYKAAACAQFHHPLDRSGEAVQIHTIK